MSGTENLFVLLTKHPVRAVRDRAENRLVAGLAAVLGSVPELAHRLLAHCLEVDVFDADVAVTVAVEQPIGPPGGWIDLVLTTGVGRESRTVWIEAKLWSGWSGDDQLQKYENALRGRVPLGRSRLVVVAPAGRRRELSALPPVGAKPVDAVGTAFLAWEEIYGLISEWMPAQPVEAVAPWLSRQFLDYMRTEADLEPIPPVTSDHLHVLEAHNEATAALDQIVVATADVLAAEWSDEIDLTNLKDWGVDFHVDDSGHRVSGWPLAATFFLWIDHVAYQAGAWIPNDADGAGDLWASTLLGEADWKIEPDGEGFSLLRERPTLSVVKAETVGGQSRVVADHAIATFEMLVTVGPPLPIQS